MITKEKFNIFVKKTNKKKLKRYTEKLFLRFFFYFAQNELN